MIKTEQHVTREMVVAEARRWLDTPFLHQGRVRGRGCDCAGLLVGVARSLGYDPIDLKAYSTIPDSAMLVQIMNRQVIRVPVEEAGPGDLVLMSFSEPQHYGILTPASDDLPNGGVIHAYNKGKRRVVETGLNERMRRMIRYAWRLPGVK
jgi:NlpC/P60 family putative phage cell wall peptidase